MYEHWFDKIYFRFEILSNFHDLISFQASLIFEKATQVPYTEVDDLASVWCEWAEMEIRHEYGCIFCVFKIYTNCKC